MAHYFITYTKTGNTRQLIAAIEADNAAEAGDAFFRSFLPATTQIVNIERVPAEIAEDFERRQRRLEMSLRRSVR